MSVLEDDKQPVEWNAGASSRTKMAGNASSTPQSQATGDTPSSGTPGGPWAPRQHRASIGRKLSVRPSLQPSSTSLQSLSSQISSLKTDSPAQYEGEDHEDGEELSPKTGESHDAHGALIAQVFEWLNQEKAKKAARKVHDTASSVYHDLVPNRAPGSSLTRERSGSQSSEKAMALDKLERILSQFSAASHSSASSLRRKRSALRNYRRGSASDSDYSDSEQGVPSVDATLDNSKALAYTGGLPETETITIPLSKQRSRDIENWKIFKSEIVRMAHTLRLKGWRRVPMDACGDVEVVRLSGALTNAVYVVSPPKNLHAGKTESSGSLIPRRPPPKLLLRIYGPQVEHLIDRDNELQILRRLGKKNIGPRVLGTFNNGRFEEYFHAHTLTPKDLRNPETSKQIAKRMRELHDGIELLEEERNGGPFIWKNWDKWVDRCEQIITWLDKEIMSAPDDSNPQGEPWMERGFVCGVPWPEFRKMVDSYRKWLDASYGGTDAIRNQLVFAHNDTQYGNLLRLEPSGESPLLLPANEHKQLVVIDFEYSSANLRGLEFANHFTEWCYNYHDAERPFACNSKAYPTPDEQRRFIKAYINHRPQGLVPAASELHSLPSGGPTAANMPARINTQGSTPVSISTPRLAPLSLDSNSELSIPDIEAEQLGEQSTEAVIQQLMHEARLWRLANSAQWVAWGIVQAKVPRMEREMAAAEQKQHGDVSTNGSAKELGAPGNGKKDVETTETLSDTSSDAGYEEDDEFDYLAYAQERALFFWADALSLGFIDEKDLPAGMLEAVKSRIVNY